MACLVHADPPMLHAAVILFFMIVPACGVCQSGFFLSYSCKKGNQELKRFEPSAKDLCLVSSPVVTLDEIAVTEHDLGSGRSMIEIRLTPASFRKLNTAMDLSPLIAFVFNDNILFTFNPATTKLHDVIQIYQVDYPWNYHHWKELIKARRNPAD